MSTVTLNRPATPLRLTPASDVWRYRELLRLVVVRNLKVRYQRTVLGFVWALLNPAATVLILVAVFGSIIRIDVPDYWAFLVSGYFAWVFVQHTLSASAFVINDHAHIVRSAGFPTEVLVLGQTLSRLVEFALELALVVMLVALFRHGAMPASLLALPLIVAMQVLMTVGLALPIAAASVFFHDIEHALPVALMLVAYLSPVFYPAEMVPDALQRIYMLNPLAILLSLYHEVLYAGRWPSPALLGVGLTVSLIVLLIGHALFHRVRRLFAEIV